MEGRPSDQLVQNPQTIVLHVLSPSTDEVPNKLTFTEIPINTTVRALKERIQNAVPARPPLPRQRLIYQGKVLASDEASLKDVFGQEAINKAEPLSLHLVLSPLPNSHLRSSSVPPTVNSVPQANVRQRWTPSFVPQAHIPPNGGPPLQPTHQGTLPNVQPGLGQLPSSLNPQMPPFAGIPTNPRQGPTPIPPHVQNVINNQLAAMSQHLAAQLATQGQQQQQMHHGQPHHQSPTQQWQQPLLPQQSFQQIIAQQQQARAAAGQHGVAQHLQNKGATGGQGSGGPNDSQPFDPSNAGNVNTVVRENQGPNGESFQMVIQGTAISRPNSRVSQQPHSQSYTPQRSSTPTNAPHSAPPNIDISTTLPPQAANSLAMFQQRLSAIETSLAGGSAPPEGVFDHARTYLDNMAGQPNTLPPSLEALLRTRLNNLATQAHHLRTSFNIANQQASPGVPQGNPLQGMPIFPMAGNQTAQQPMPGYTAFNPAFQGTPTIGTSISSERSAQPSSAPEIYLLSSPTGPHSLLIPPSGWFTTTLPPMFPSIPHIQPSAFNQFAPPHTSPLNQAPTNSPLNPQPQQANPPDQPPAPPAPTHIAQAQQQQAQAQQNNQARDLARILLPLGGHLWLLIRLFGFVYFFTAGGGHRRAILLGICAFIVFIANTGAFRPLFRTLWEPVRRHVEGLIPLAAAGGGRDERQQRPRREQQQQQQQGQIDNAAAGGDSTQHNTRATRTRQQPSPSDLADRLLRERNEQSLFRRAERAIALFLASLVPGVGERHIAARDAAEARRLEAEQEMEVRAQREREEQEEREMEVQEQERVRRESAVGPPQSPGLAESSGRDVTGPRSDEGVRERGGEGGHRPLVEI